MKNLIESASRHLRTHWITTLKGVVYISLFLMFLFKKINVNEWILATGSIMGINSLFQKDANKVVTKPEVKAKHQDEN